MGYVFGNKKVREHMKKGIVTVKFYAPIKDALDIMTREDVTGIVAVDDMGGVMGMLSTFDVIKNLKDMDSGVLDEMTVEDIMTPNTIQINANDTLEKAAEVMLENKVHRLVVLHPSGISGHVPVGMLSSTDIVRELNTFSK